jgi:hypothetical protein
MDAGRADNEPRKQDAHDASSSAATPDQEECKQMYVEDPKTSLPTRPPTVLEGEASYGVRDAKPVDLWAAWLFAAAESSLMLEAWRVEATDRVGVYAGYRAALDREEQAALVLANRVATWLEGA